jgi:hypothetical protein
MQGKAVGEQPAEVAEKSTEKPAEGAGKRDAARQPHPCAIEMCEYYRVATLEELREAAEDLEVWTEAMVQMNRKDLVAYLTRHVKGL